MWLQVKLLVFMRGIKMKNHKCYENLEYLYRSSLKRVGNNKWEFIEDEEGDYLTMRCVKCGKLLHLEDKNHEMEK